MTVILVRLKYKQASETKKTSETCYVNLSSTSTVTAQLDQFFSEIQSYYRTILLSYESKTTDKRGQYDWMG